MADPIIADHFRAQVVLQSKTGDPKDTYVNNFVFRNDGGPIGSTSVADNIAQVLEDFYNVPVAPQASAPAGFIPGDLVQPDVLVKVYDLGLAPPRFPEERTFTLTGMSTNEMPEEVAVCLSYAAGKNAPRFRGRIFFGPLSSGAVAVDTGRTRVAPLLQEVLVRSANRLMSGNGGGVTWVLLSPTDLDTKVITGGWVDDAFDTMRKRGPESRGRLTWGAYDGQWGTTLP